VFIASMIVILKPGAAFVRLDPEYRVERLDYMITDSGANVVLTQERLAGRLPGDIASLSVESALQQDSAHIDLAASIAATDPAYVIYTSGSTGTPKGAVIPHRAIVRLVRDTNYCDFSEDQVFLQASTVCFDASVFEIYGALLNGATLVLTPPGPLTLETIGTAIEANHVTTLWLTSGLFQLIVDEKIDSLKGVTQLLTGGDIVSVNHATKIMSEMPGCRLIDGYGPTENTTFTTCHTITKSDVDRGTIPIGRPIANTTAYILDQYRQPVPVGVAGELFTGGDGLALRYLNNPGLTTEKFVPHPFGNHPEDRLYRTGDRCRFLPNGEIEFLGRIDHQVKIRGFRVEPGEIESRLLTHPAVNQCKIIARGTGAGDKLLVGYIAPVAGSMPTDEELCLWLRDRLPEFMVPSAYMIIDELPVNANGKIDTHALPEPEAAAIFAPGKTQPETDTQKQLSLIWKDILDQDEIGIDDDFFALGGHSLLGMKLFTRIQKSFDLALPLATLFQSPTIRLLAKAIDRESDPAASEDSPVDTSVLVQSEGDKIPLFGIHGGDGGIFFYRRLFDHLGNDRPLYAFEDPALTSTTPISDEPIEETASRYVDQLRRLRKEGPYMLAGYSFGGIVALEMAQQLLAAGEEVAFLGLFDTENPTAEIRQYPLLERLAVNWQSQDDEAGMLGKLGKLGKRVGSGLVTRLRHEATVAAARTLTPAKSMSRLRQVQLREAHGRAMDAYVPAPYDGKITLYKAKANAENDKFEMSEDYGWRPIAKHGLDIVEVPGEHLTIFDDENVGALAKAVHTSLTSSETSIENPTPTPPSTIIPQPNQCST
jgi:amino acid adenylation domain-containing protein